MSKQIQIIKNMPEEFFCRKNKFLNSISAYGVYWKDEPCVRILYKR